MFKLIRIGAYVLPLFIFLGCGQQTEFKQNVEISSLSTSTRLSWLAPVTRTNGSALSASEIAGYQIYYGKISGAYSNSINVGNVTSYAIPNTYFSSGLYYFAVKAYTKDGLQSIFSDEVSANIK